MSSPESVTVILRHAVKRDGVLLHADTVQEFPPVEATRLIARGAAALPAPPRVSLPESTGELVKAFTPEGAKFARLGEKKAADVVLDTMDPALLAEFQALEYRRAEGVRAVVVEALQLAFSTIKAPLSHPTHRE